MKWKSVSYRFRYAMTYCTFCVHAEHVTCRTSVLLICARDLGLTSHTHKPFCVKHSQVTCIQNMLDIKYHAIWLIYTYILCINLCNISLMYKKIISFTELSQGMQVRSHVQLSCSLTLDLICTCVGKKSQDFSGSLSGNTDLTELMTIWKVREMDKTLKNFLLEKVNMYYETCTVSWDWRSRKECISWDPGTLKRQENDWDVLLSFAFLHTSMHFVNVHLHYRC